MLVRPKEVCGSGVTTIMENTDSGVLNVSAGVVIVAAGTSSRMEGTDKIFVELGAQPLIAHTIDAFEQCSYIQSIVLVVGQGQGLWDAGKLVDERTYWNKIRSIQVGGPRRQDSVAIGLEALPPCEWVIVHDGARPLIEPEIIRRGLEVAVNTGTAVAAVPVKDTIKLVNQEHEVVDTPDRSGLWLAQTPQIFRRDLLERAHTEILEDVPDDAAMVARLGFPVKIFMGSYRNIKITTVDDLALASVLLQTDQVDK
jgi:2-C-methyl-D-erythritol 4-phosphate cytidylyltransferase